MIERKVEDALEGVEESKDGHRKEITFIPLLLLIEESRRQGERPENEDEEGKDGEDDALENGLSAALGRKEFEIGREFDLYGLAFLVVGAWGLETGDEEKKGEEAREGRSKKKVASSFQRESLIFALFDFIGVFDFWHRRLLGEI